MQDRITRRRLLKFMGGSAAGILLTPIPWKTIDDVAIWTQNWSWIPKPPRGEVRTKFSACALCPVGCGIRARCVGDHPVSLSGVREHPISRGALCPIGLGGHHLQFHPARLLQPVRIIHRDGGIEPVPISMESAVAKLGNTLSRLKSDKSAGAIAILDERPGRITSQIYRRFLAATGNGVYLVPASAAGSSFGTLQSMLEEPYTPCGLDLDNTGMILSFGAPILDGWGSPGRIPDIRKKRSDVEKRLRLVQVEACRSRTALLADLWIPINPGTEVALALGLAHILIKERLCNLELIRSRAMDFETSNNPSYLQLVEHFSPETVARITGIGRERICETARMAARFAPALAIGGGDPGGGPLGEQEETAIWSLNLLLGSVSAKGGVVPHRLLPADSSVGEGRLASVTEISALPDRSVGLLIMDSAASGRALPWTLIEKKLVPKESLVVSLSPMLADSSRRADLVIPAPAHLEAFQDLATPYDSPVATFSVSAPLLRKPPGVIDPVDLLRRLSSEAGAGPDRCGQAMTLVDHLKGRANEVFRAGRGRVFSAQDARWMEMTEVESGDKLWEQISEGACWVDAEPDNRPLPNCRLLGRSPDAFERLAAMAGGRLRQADRQYAAYPFVLMTSGWRGSVGNASLSPIMTKLFQESGVRDSLNQASINPETGGAMGLADGGKAIVETSSGMIRVGLRFDSTVMPGVICVAVGPLEVESTQEPRGDDEGILRICRLDQDSVWRVTPAKVREA